MEFVLDKITLLNRPYFKIQLTRGPTWVYFRKDGFIAFVKHTGYNKYTKRAYGLCPVLPKQDYEKLEILKSLV